MLAPVERKLLDRRKRLTVLAQRPRRRSADSGINATRLSLKKTRRLLRIANLRLWSITLTEGNMALDMKTIDRPTQHQRTLTISASTRALRSQERYLCTRRIDQQVGSSKLHKVTRAGPKQTEAQITVIGLRERRMHFRRDRLKAIRTSLHPFIVLNRQLRIRSNMCLQRLMRVEVEVRIHINNLASVINLFRCQTSHICFRSLARTTTPDTP